ncbi:MAG: hypothetical protein K2Q09_09225, partial [Phycisphaerales bacterium]|nr:hypothetical protein [Phycisphaerales bacterium]
CSSWSFDSCKEPYLNFIPRWRFNGSVLFFHELCEGGRRFPEHPDEQTAIAALGGREKPECSPELFEEGFRGVELVQWSQMRENSVELWLLRAREKCQQGVGGNFEVRARRLPR